MPDIQIITDLAKYEFDFAGHFLATEAIVQVALASTPSGLVEVRGARRVDGFVQTVYIDAGLATPGTLYTLAVQAISSSGLKHTLYKDIIVQDEPVGITAIPPSAAADGIYSAILSQSGTNAPTAVINANTLLAGTPVWTRTGEGTYVATLTGAFLEGKTRVLANIVPLQVGSESKAAGIRLTDDTIQVIVRDFADNPVDGFTTLYIDIQTY